MTTTNDVPGPDDQSGYAIPYEFAVLMRFLIYRINRNMEAQIMITSRSAIRGLGKTHLALALAKTIHDCAVCRACGYIWFYAEDECPRCEASEGWDPMPEWSHETNAFFDVDEYVNACLRTEKEVMVFDEIEHAADSRRPMAADNVTLAQTLMTLRLQNNVMICTLPTPDVLDGRVRDLVDVWINVQERGLAHGYHYWLNDFTGDRGIIRHRLENGMIESITWRALDGDEDAEAMERRKRDMMIGKHTGELSDEAKAVAKDAVEKREIELFERALDKLQVAQTTLAEDVWEKSAGWGSNANYGRLPAQDSDSDKYPIRD